MGKTALERLRGVTIGEAFRVVAAVLAVWGSIWAFGGAWVTARADEALVEALRRKGMSPEAIVAMRRQLSDLGIDVQALRTSAAHTNEEIDAMQKRLEAMDAKSTQTYDLLKTLIPLMKAELQAP